jgi:hypothetical protein
MTQSPQSNPMPENKQPDIKAAPLTEAEKAAKLEADRKAGNFNTKS